MPEYEYEVLDEFEGGRVLLHFATGGLAGRTVMAFPEAECFPNAIRPVSPFERAERLLLSLLTPTQVETWRQSQTFVVPTPYGTLEFGHVSDMRFWPTEGDELRLCVVPAQHGRGLPAPDIWANLLLAVTDDPLRFFTVANWRRLSGGWYYGPVPGLARRQHERILTG